MPSFWYVTEWSLKKHTFPKRHWTLWPQIVNLKGLGPLRFSLEYPWNPCLASRQHERWSTCSRRWYIINARGNGPNPTEVIYIEVDGLASYEHADSHNLMKPFAKCPLHVQLSPGSERNTAFVGVFVRLACTIHQPTCQNKSWIERNRLAERVLEGGDICSIDEK